MREERYLKKRVGFLLCFLDFFILFFLLSCLALGSRLNCLEMQ